VKWKTKRSCLASQARTLGLPWQRLRCALWHRAPSQRIATPTQCGVGAAPALAGMPFALSIFPRQGKIIFEGVAATASSKMDLKTRTQLTFLAALAPGVKRHFRAASYRQYTADVS
jgi:hypothetical protein